MTFGKRLKETRKSLGLTQQGLATLANASKTRIWELENQENVNPKMELLKKISMSIGKSLDYLAFGEGSDDYMSMRHGWEKLADDEQDKIRGIMRVWVDKARLNK